jgi:DNA-binding MarR family transcriptional regulator
MKNAQSSGNNLGPMELFILVLIGPMGLTSLYAFKDEAGLEPGGIRAALARLENDRLITRADPGRRRRRDLALTPAGISVLQNSWKGCLHDHGDAESVLRSAFVAWLMDGPAAAADYLNQIAEYRRERAQQIMNDAAHLERSQTGPLSSYTWMRASQEAHRRRAESEAFLSMCRSIKERFNNNASNTRNSTATSE